MFIVGIKDDHGKLVGLVIKRCIVVLSIILTNPDYGLQLLNPNFGSIRFIRIQSVILDFGLNPSIWISDSIR